MSEPYQTGPDFRMTPSSGIRISEATCPHCGCVNRVAGLSLPSPDAQLHTTPHALVCGACGASFKVSRPQQEQANE